MLRSALRNRTLLGLAAFVCAAPLIAQVPRMPDGKPDLTGIYNKATLTPVERPPEYGDNLYMTREDAEKIAEEQKKLIDEANSATDQGERSAPKKGGLGTNAFGAGNVGGYNSFWVDMGDEAFTVDGKFRTSIIYDPPNGRMPQRTPKGFQKLIKNFASFAYDNDGTASWLDKPGPGPFDGPETLALAERCLVGFSAGPPMLPGLYNNYLRFVQTDDHLMILMEMVHDVRAIRIGGEHDDPTPRWLGESVGRWEGDTLVVETKNFREATGFYGGDANLNIIERFTRQEDGSLLYNFTVDDPTAFRGKFTGEYPLAHMTGEDERVYEYACHEGNYAMGNILRGARILESEYDEPPKTDDDD